MCYCCDLCNRCGRADKMNAQLGQRECPMCHKLEIDNEVKKCVACGAPLPPPFPKDTFRNR